MNILYGLTPQCTMAQNVSAGRVKVLVSVCRLGVKISDQSVMLLTDGHIQEVDLLVRNF